MGQSRIKHSIKRWENINVELFFRTLLQDAPQIYDDISHVASGSFSTLYNVILRIARNLLETRVMIKFWPILAAQETLTDFHGDEEKEKKKKIQKKKFKMAYSKKTSFSIPPSLNIFSQKFHGLVLGLEG